jgi:hypothetical protein
MIVRELKLKPNESQTANNQRKGRRKIVVDGGLYYYFIKGSPDHWYDYDVGNITIYSAESGRYYAEHFEKLSITPKYVENIIREQFLREN